MAVGRYLRSSWVPLWIRGVCALVDINKDAVNTEVEGGGAKYCMENLSM
jgi:hypothetical protein